MFKFRHCDDAEGCPALSPLMGPGKLGFAFKGLGAGGIFAENVRL